MSDGDWRRYLKALRFGGACAIAVAALFGAWYLGGLNASYFHNAEQEAEEYARDTRQHVADACLYRPGFVECADQIIKASQEAQTAQNDLAAQRSMALWALCMFVASLASVAVTGVGIYFVWLNLKEARKVSEHGERSAAGAEAAAKAAQASIEQSSLNAQRQLRAYVFLSNIDSHWVANRETENVIGWVFTPVWKNWGQTPTVFGRANVNYAFVDGNGEEPLSSDFPDYGDAGDILVAPGATMNAHPFRIDINQAVRLFERRARAFGWGSIDYNDVFDGTERHRFEFCFEIIATGNPTHKAGGFAYPRLGKFNGHDAECYRKPSGRFGET
jgi:hypothetical protein